LGHGQFGCDGLTVVVGFVGCWCGEPAAAVEDLAVAAPVVEPVDVLEGGELDVLEAFPWALRVDELPLVDR
jgi:hypothetical protein